MPKFPTPQQQHKQDEVASRKHQTEARRDFRVVQKELEPYWSQALAAVPGRGPDIVSSRARVFVKLVKDLPSVKKFLDRYIGDNDDDPRADSWRASMVYAWRDVFSGKRGLNEVLEKVDVIASQGYQAKTMTRAQKPIRSVLPPELRAFLPNNIVVDVDDDGYIQRVTDRFENERFTLGQKIERLKTIVSQYNDIVTQVKKDLVSADEVTKLAALVTSIIMETGIRPGRAGNTKFKVENGEEIAVETFGAVTLGPEHVRFVRDNFAELQFVGKATTINTATLADGQIIKVLQEYVARALEKGSKYIFVTADGATFDYRDLEKYFRHRFKGLAPTDFRKLKATETVYNSLLEHQADLYSRIRSFVSEEEGDLRERVVSEIVATIEQAIESAQKALNHEDPEVTKGSYINPQILLQFFAQGRSAKTLRDAILDGRTKLEFDPMTFVEAAKAMPLALAASLRRGTLRELLEDLEQDLGESSPARVASAWRASV